MFEEAKNVSIRIIKSSLHVSVLNSNNYSGHKNASECIYICFWHFV